MATVYFTLQRNNFEGPLHVLIKNAAGETVKERDTYAASSYSQTVTDNDTYTFYFSADNATVVPAEVTLPVTTTSVSYNKKIVITAEDNTDIEDPDPGSINNGGGTIVPGLDIGDSSVIIPDPDAGDSGIILPDIDSKDDSGTVISPGDINNGSGEIIIPGDISGEVVVIPGGESTESGEISPGGEQNIPTTNGNSIEWKNGYGRA